MLKVGHHREDHGITEHFNKVLVEKSHVPCPKEAQLFGAVLLHSYELLCAAISRNCEGSGHLLQSSEVRNMAMP